MLPEYLMRELRYIEVATTKRMLNMRSGAFTSRLRGIGFDFDEHRLYSPGEDVRRIDWNVTARLNEPFIRQTHAERELNLVVALDLSPSMKLGTERYSKKELTLLVAACFAFSALADQINIGFLSFSDRVISYHRPQRMRVRAWTALQELWDVDPPVGRTAIAPAARYLAGRLKKASIIVIVSDFITDEDLAGSKDLRVLATKHDVIGVVIEDPLETTLPKGTGTIRLRDLESGAMLRLGLGARLRRQYGEMAQKRRADLIKAFYRVPMDHIVVRSDASLVEPLLRLFATRKRA